MAAASPVLLPEAQKRYKEKIAVIGVDPYSLGQTEFTSGLDLNLSQLPDLQYADIYNYLINTPGLLIGY